MVDSDHATTASVGRRRPPWAAAALIAAALPTEQANTPTGEIQRLQFALVINAAGRRPAVQVRRAFEAMATTYEQAQSLATELHHAGEVKSARVVQRALDRYRSPTATAIGATPEQRRIRLAGLIGAVADMQQRGTDPARAHQFLMHSPTATADWDAVTSVLIDAGYRKETTAFDARYDQWLRDRPGWPNPRFNDVASFADLRAVYGRPDRLAALRDGLGLRRPRWERTAEVAAHLPTVGPDSPQWSLQVRMLQPFVARVSWRQLRTVIGSTGVSYAPDALRAAAANTSQAAVRAVERAIESDRSTPGDRWLQRAVWEARTRTPGWRRAFVAAAARPGSDAGNTAAAQVLMGPRMYVQVAERVLLRFFPRTVVADQHEAGRSFRGITNDTPAASPPSQWRTQRFPDTDRSVSADPPAGLADTAGPSVHISSAQHAAFGRRHSTPHPSRTPARPRSGHGR